MVSFPERSVTWTKVSLNEAERSVRSWFLSRNEKREEKNVVSSCCTLVTRRLSWPTKDSSYTEHEFSFFDLRTQRGGGSNFSYFLCFRRLRLNPSRRQLVSTPKIGLSNIPGSEDNALTIFEWNMKQRRGKERKREFRIFWGQIIFDCLRSKFVL